MLPKWAKGYLDLLEVLVETTDLEVDFDALIQQLADEAEVELTL